MLIPISMPMPTPMLMPTPTSPSWPDLPLSLLRPQKPPPGSEGGEPAEGTASDVETAEKREVHPRERLLCAACGQLVTHGEHALEVANQHSHTFVNPGGFVYKIRCFSHAQGCSGQGPSSDVWTWFPGYLWQLGICTGCGAQLGWIFRGPAHIFFGLIIERLVEASD